MVRASSATIVPRDTIVATGATITAGITAPNVEVRDT